MERESRQGGEQKHRGNILSSQCGFLLHGDLRPLKINADGLFKIGGKAAVDLFSTLRSLFLPSREYLLLYIYSDLVSLNGILKQAGICRSR